MVLIVIVIIALDIFIRSFEHFWYRKCSKVPWGSVLYFLNIPKCHTKIIPLKKKKKKQKPWQSGNVTEYPHTGSRDNCFSRFTQLLNKYCPMLYNFLLLSYCSSVLFQAYIHVDDPCLKFLAVSGCTSCSHRAIQSPQQWQQITVHSPIFQVAWHLCKEPVVLAWHCFYLEYLEVFSNIYM